MKRCGHAKLNYFLLFMVTMVPIHTNFFIKVLGQINEIVGLCITS